MTQSATITNEHRPSDVLTSLASVCTASGLDALAVRLGELKPWLEGDLAVIERELRSALGGGETLAEKSALHLLRMPGKRLRPLCVALASHVGAGFGSAARELAVAVELVHSATLLHDDVVDLGDLRRGVPAARTIYGNAASIFGGDWLLVEALGRVQRAAVPGILERMLAVIREMVIAESRQLAARGRISLDREHYFEIVRGKTASLFRWAMFAGGRAGGASETVCAALERYGENLGVAFQVVDDLLDVVGDPEVTGKSALADLREGKMTYPLILAAERDPGLRAALEAAVVQGVVDVELSHAVAKAMEGEHVVPDCEQLADDLCRDAITSLSVLAPSKAKGALEALAVATLRRRS